MTERESQDIFHAGFAAGISKNTVVQLTIPPTREAKLIFRDAMEKGLRAAMFSAEQEEKRKCLTK